jgi:hypothetical protein
MKIGESRLQDLSMKPLQSDKAKKSEDTQAVTGSMSTVENGLINKSSSFVNDVKALNETMLGIGLAESSMQKINGDKMEEAVQSLRSITSSLKDILTKNFGITNQNSEDYSVDAVKAKLQGTNPSNLHDFDYLATKAASLLA